MLLKNGGEAYFSVRRDLKQEIIYYKDYFQRQSYPDLESIYINNSYELYRLKKDYK